MRKSESGGARPREAPTDSGSGGRKFSRMVPDLIAELGERSGGSHSSIDHGNGAETVTRPVFPTSANEQTQVRPPQFTMAEVDENRVNRHVVAITDPNSLYTEEYRNLRTTVLQKSKKQKLKTVAVASVSPSEGKSVTALNLGWLLAQTQGIRALVVDADLRLPSLAEYLGVDYRSGLSEVIDGEIGLMDAIVELQPSGLYVLPGGRSRSDAAEQISGPAFAGILQRLEEMFDFVIIDAPPLGVFVDAKVLINQTDASILVVRSNFTGYKEVERIMEGLPRQRMLGVVLNQAEETLINGRYYDYPYYKRY